jgi:hypothetical protein
MEKNQLIITVNELNEVEIDAFNFYSDDKQR